MRKTKQEITSLKEIEDIIQRADICRLAMCSNDIPYVVPLNFGYANGSFYFHCAKEGLKLDIIRDNNLVCFEIESDLDLRTTDEPCTWSQKFKSVIGWGRASILEEREEKRHALLIMMNHYEKRAWEIPNEKVDTVSVIEVKVERMTAKRDGN